MVKWLEIIFRAKITLIFVVYPSNIEIICQGMFLLQHVEAYQMYCCRPYHLRFVTKGLWRYLILKKYLKSFLTSNLC